MTQANKKSLGEREFEKSIVKYLQKNPEFFSREPELLADILLPHERGTAISLVERQVAVLRQQKDELKKQLHLLVQNSKNNEKLSDKVNLFIIALLGAPNFIEFLDIISSQLVKDFKADSVVLRLFQSQFKNTKAESIIQTREEFVDWSEPVLGAFEKVIKGRQPVCGNLKKGQLDSLFETQADDVSSAALIPLIDNSDSHICYGMLAIASKDRNHFHAEMGTLFLSHLGKIVAILLQQYR
ncbi:Protein of unknown function DUF484 [hydrothermal vent metagenome]|uniref:DUF484 family protein n=1 Tax=hydrothermal vent metagenome TaxID=652676 RepID=A0A3B1A504_9ZZZZ